ncbi:TRAP transporter small permease subunit [Roseovarius sp.]|uniref:TRAP transporter small permease n=1 Tax=Roseovarius sp. TaxID=1486281 RepID=UPI00261DEFED|nr:TRAP transporter small permease subunit [Roseovarius sp.]MDM8165886.1 TRAP transporter small permease subunit [Roseovarius sp.]
METGQARWHERAGVFASAALLIVLFALLLADVILRWLQVEFYWGSEGGGLLMAWMIFLALPMVMRTRGHIATDFVVAHLPGRARAVLSMAGHVLMIAYLCCLVWYCADLAHSNWQGGARFQGILRLPMYVVQSGILFGIVLMLLSEVLILWEEARAFGRAGGDRS